MRASRGEIKIEEILQDAGLTFEEEYIFPGLRSDNGRPLRFDFVIFDDDGKFDQKGCNIKENSIMNLAQNLVGKKVFISNNIMIIKNEDFALSMILN